MLVRILNVNTKENNVRFRDFFAIFGIYFGANIGLGMIVGLFLNIEKPIELLRILGYVNLAGSAIATLCVLYYIKKTKRTFFKRSKEYVDSKGELVKKEPWTVQVLTVTYMILTIFTPTVILSIFKNTNNQGDLTTTNQEALTGLSSAMNPIALFFMIVVFAPIIEEILFRGVPIFFHSRFEKLNSPKMLVARVVVFGVLFGLMHNPKTFAEILAYSSSGIFMGLSVLTTNRLETSIKIHMMNNFLGYLAMIQVM